MKFKYKEHIRVLSTDFYGGFYGYVTGYFKIPVIDPKTKKSTEQVWYHVTLIDGRTPLNVAINEQDLEKDRE